MQLRALRVIAVSGRSALAKERDPEDREALRERLLGLFADLEQAVMANSADERVLAAIERERRMIPRETQLGGDRAT